MKGSLNEESDLFGHPLNPSLFDFIIYLKVHMCVPSVGYTLVLPVFFCLPFWVEMFFILKHPFLVYVCGYGNVPYQQLYFVIGAKLRKNAMCR